jgi:hypothetical protein
MRALLAITVSGLLALSGPVFAQSNSANGQYGNSQGQAVNVQAVNGQGQTVDGQGQSANDQTTQDGLGALAQVPPPSTPPTDYTGLLVGALALGGGAAIIAATQKHSDNTTSASP